MRASLGAHSSWLRLQKPSGVKSCGNSAAASGSPSRPINSAKNRRSESSWCFMMSNTDDDLSAGLKAMSSLANCRHKLTTLFVSLAYVSSRCWKTVLAARGICDSGIAVYSYCMGMIGLQLVTSILRFYNRSCYQTGKDKSHCHRTDVSQRVIAWKSVPVPIGDVGADRGQTARNRNETPAPHKVDDPGLAKQYHRQQNLENVGSQLNDQCFPERELE